ncbi:MAG TPA: Mur ligase domain-containing protein [Burkholderiales bacterium]|nr:Mur ligase domain-containing protein [Burkholderiales bacterium]
MMYKVKRIHFVGIGGSGMSGIAEVLLNLKYKVSGSDVAASAATERLRARGAKVHIGHDARHVARADAVVISSAIKHDNPEIAEARKRNIPVVPRALMLAELMRLKQGIAVAGTHAKLGESEYLVVEADESDASFLYLQPVIAVVTNIDVDHMETYNHDYAQLKNAFRNFIDRLPFYGTAVLCTDDKAVAQVIPLVSRQVLTYGMFGDPDIRAVDAEHHAGQMKFKVVRGTKRLPRGQARHLDVTLNLPGKHNVQNALAAIAVAQELEINDDALLQALAEFQGVGRRLQRYGEVKLRANCVVGLIDDYGHHPVEMRATLDAVRGAYPGRPLLLAFQPHRYTRTRDLFEKFVEVLSSADRLVLSEVYPAGETPIAGATSRALARSIRKLGKARPFLVEDVAQVEAAVRAHAKDGDVVVTMGAGSIGNVPAQLAAGQR